LQELLALLVYGPDSNSADIFNVMADTFKKSIFDSIHGFISLTHTEDRIISSPYFQRLRWIKQLGWSHYIYPGATHTRFAHALGVMAVMDKLVKSIGRGVDDDKLFNTKIHDKRTMFHRKLRLAALLHDIGTFPFSHSVEFGYINHYKSQIREGKRTPLANHEELGSHILNNTDFEDGITHILRGNPKTHWPIN
jgi:HD superfamily phosphohydrolase